MEITKDTLTRAYLSDANSEYRDISPDFAVLKLPRSRPLATAGQQQLQIFGSLEVLPKPPRTLNQDLHVIYDCVSRLTEVLL